MSFRQRTTRFGGTPTVARQPDPSLLSPFLVSREPIPVVRRRRRVRKKKPTKRPTKRPTTRPTTRPTRRRPTKRPTTVFRPARPRPRPRDDFQRSLTPTIIPRAFAEVTPRTLPETLAERTRTFLGVPPERIAQPPTRVVREEIRPEPRPTVVKKPPRVSRVRPTRVFAPPEPRDDIQRSVTPPSVQLAFAQPPPEQVVEPTPERPRIRVPIEEQREANIRAVKATGITFEEAQLRELSPIEAGFQSFTGGARQEFENIGAIAGFGTAREEFGSLAVGLPFEVLGETFTRPSEDEGFLGLGFQFRERPDIEAGLTKSAQIQEKIGRKFEEDPARALGSLATIGAIEAGLLITTGGVGNLARRGLVGTARFVGKSKSRKSVEKIARETTDAKRGVPNIVEDLGDGRFAIVQGQEEIVKRGIRVTTPAEAVGIQITRAGKLIESKVPIIRGITKKGTKGKLKGKTIKVTTDVNKQAEVPLIIVDTKKRLVRDAVTGVVKREDPQTFFFNRNIPERTAFLDNPSLLAVRGAVQERVIFSPRQRIATGFQPAVGREFGIVARNPTPKALKSTLEAEKVGEISIAGRGISVLTKDAKRTPNLFSQFAEAQKPITRGRLPPTGRAEILEGIRPPAELTGIPFRPVEVFQARTIGGLTLSRFLSPDPRQQFLPFIRPRVQPRRPLTPPREPRAPTPEELFEPTPTRARQPRPVQARPAPPRATQVEEVLEEFFTPAQRARVRPVRVPIPTQVAIAGVIPTQIGRQFVSDDLSLIQDVVAREEFRLGDAQRLIQPSAQIQPQPQQVIPEQIFPERPITTPIFPQDVTPARIPQLGQVIIPQLDVGQPLVPFIPERPETPPPPLVPFAVGAPVPFAPFGELRRRRRTAISRRSRLGRRLFDIADEPFGAIEVGLGFFAEQRTGRETIAELIGEGDEPLTRQERRARERLRGRRRQQNFAEGFDLSDFFS